MKFKNKIYALITILAVAHQVIGKCVNHTDFKYELTVPSEITNYYSLCSEFSRRTCCSPNNFDLLTKKYFQFNEGL
jgi:hypothetical protein